MDLNPGEGLLVDSSCSLLEPAVGTHSCEGLAQQGLTVRSGHPVALMALHHSVSLNAATAAAACWIGGQNPTP